MSENFINMYLIIGVILSTGSKQFSSCYADYLKEEGNFPNDSKKLKLLGDVGNSEITRNKKKMEGGLMEQILPKLIIPFLVSSLLIPPMLISIIILLLKNVFIAKAVILLAALNFFRRRINKDGVRHEDHSNIAQELYGYQGIDEPGSYIHKKRRKRYYVQM